MYTLQALYTNISIHAPLTGSDVLPDRRSDPNTHFNPRSPHRERPKTGKHFTNYDLFQSTLPSQGATRSWCRTSCFRLYFNPRSPHRERLVKESAPFICLYISIHAPLTGSDLLRAIGLSFSTYIFQSTLPSQGATAVPISTAVFLPISIHAPLTGSDSKYTHKIPL